MNIGEAAENSGVSAKMIRYYEEIGLVRPADRSPSGYRTYDHTSVHTLRFVRRARDLGFPIERIRELLKLWTDTSRASHEVKEIALSHVAALDADIAKLKGLRDLLSHLAGQCHGDERPECPILDDLGGEAQAAKPARRN
jgi:MerR family copper efflux transcriptional regulator